MELKGKLLDVSRDILSGLIRITFTAESLPSGLDKLRGKDLLIQAKEWRGRRTLNANAYYWTLVGRIARELGTQQAFVHNMLLRDYGTLEEADGQNLIVMVPDTDDAAERVMMSEHYHLKPTSFVRDWNGRTCREYLVIRGSSTYDTGEMSALINGAVSEAKSLGIETLSEDALKEMLGEHYGEYHSNQR